MPKVPQFQKRVRDTALQKTKLQKVGSIEGFGGGQAAANVVEAGKSVISASQKIILAERDKADQLAVLDADKQLSSIETGLLYDPKNGAMSVKGKNTLSLPDTTMTAFDESVSEIEATLSTERQKAIFRAQSKTRRNDLDRSIQRHMSREIQKHDEEVTKSYNLNEQNAAIENFADWREPNGRVQKSIDRQIANLKRNQERQGKPDETFKAEVQQAMNATHQGVISRMLSGGKDQEARDYFKAHKDQITGEAETRIQAAIKEGSLRGNSQRKTDEIMSGSGKNQEKLDKARAISNPELRDETVRRVKARIKEDQEMKRIRQEELNEKANSIIDETPRKDAIPPDMWKQLTSKQRRNIEKRLAGGTDDTDFTTYYDLKTMAQAAPESFVKEDLRDYQDRINQKDLKGLLSLQTRIREKDPSVTGDLRGIRSQQNIINDSLISVGISPRKDPERAALFNREVDEAVIQWKEENDKDKIPAKELRQITDDLVMKATIKKPFYRFDSEKMVFELTSADIVDFDFDDIPQSEKDKIVEGLRANGRVDIMNAEILKIYKASLERARSR